MKFNDGHFLTTEKISPHLEKTSEGYLLCKSVPISRVGEFPYSSLEVGIPAKNGKVLMTRTADELFSEATMKSFNAKPVVIGHGKFADPENWKDISIGIVQNVRRGDGESANDLLADLLITDKRGIELVESGRLREVSCGYDATPVADGVGFGHQVGIVGNHVALVQKARCGSTCSIRDGVTMNIKTLLRRIFKDGDEEKFNEALDKIEVTEIKDEESADPIVPPTDPESPEDDRLAVLEHEYKEMAQKIQLIMDRLDGKETTDEENEEEGVNEEESQSEPEVEVVPDDEVKEVLADAETVAEGMKRPVGDSEGGQFSRNYLERIMRTALKDGGVTKFGDADSLGGQALRIALKAAAESVRSEKNPTVKQSNFADGQVGVLDAINQRNKEFWSK